MRVSILIPVFQEAATVREVLSRVVACPTEEAGFEREVLVCDDGSTDGTARAIEDFVAEGGAVRAFFHERNRGKGSAIRTLLPHATGDCVLVQDADLEYAIEDALDMLRAFARGHDAVYGSRFLRRAWPEGMAPANLAANRILTGAANVLYGHSLTDEATCLKLVRTDVLRRMSLECERFEFCPEVTAKLGRMAVPIFEVPVGYRGRGVIEGKKIGWRDGAEALFTLVRHRFGAAP